MTTNTVSASAPALPAFNDDPSTLPELYGLRVKGNCMFNTYPDGTDVALAKSLPYGKGDIVTVWLKPECVAPGTPRALIKRVAMVAPPWVKGYPYKEHPQSELRAVIFLTADDMPGKMFAIECRNIAAIHKCTGLLAEAFAPVKQAAAASQPRAPRRRTPRKAVKA